MIIIIGAGISGLALAYYLKENGHQDIQILEATSRIGGRLYTDHMAGKHPVDLGGTWIGEGQTEIMDLVKSLNVPLVEQYSKGNIVFHFNGKRALGESFPNWNLLAMLDFQLNAVWKVQRLAKKVNLSNPNDPLTQYYDSISVYAWAEQNMWTTTARSIMLAVLRSELTAEPSECSMASYLAGIKNAEGNVTETMQYRFKNGASSICQALVEKIGRDKICLDEKVVSIHQDNHNDNVTVVTSSGKKYHGNRVVLALPPSTYRKMDIHPALPTRHIAFTNRFVMGSAVKAIICYDTPFWRNDNFSGTVLSDSLVSAVFDTSSDKVFSLTAFVFASSVPEFMQKSTAERKSCVLKQLEKFFPGSFDYIPLDYKEYNWLEDIAEGTYGNFLGGSLKYGNIAELHQPHGRIHFCCSDISEKWNGYMSGGVHSALRVLKELSAIAP